MDPILGNAALPVLVLPPFSVKFSWGQLLESLKSYLPLKKNGKKSLQWID